MPFYEARPVKPEICLIGSAFYPSFHEGNLPLSTVVSINLCDNTYPLWRARSPKRRPGCCRANQNKLQTSYTINPFPTSKLLRRRADEKTKPIRPYDLQFQLLYHTMVDHPVTSPSTSPAISSPPPLSLSSYEMGCLAKDVDTSDEAMNYNATQAN